MSQYALQQPIEELWERRESLSSATGGEARGAVEAALDLLDSGAARVAEPSRVGLAGQSVAEEGGIAVVPADGFDGDGGRGRSAGVGQGAVEVRRLG